MGIFSIFITRYLCFVVSIQTKRNFSLLAPQYDVNWGTASELVNNPNNLLLKSRKCIIGEENEMGKRQIKKLNKEHNNSLKPYICLFPSYFLIQTMISFDLIFAEFSYSNFSKYEHFH